MPYDKRRVSGTVGASGSLTTPLASDFAEIIGFRALSTGDTATSITITDGASRVLYKDAADKDYTAQKDTIIGLDDTSTGLAGVLYDSTGAASTIPGGNGAAAQSPITVTWANGTAGDTLTFDVYYRYPMWKASTTLTVPNPAATITGLVPLRSKFGQVLAFRALLTGTDTAVRIKMTDADSRVFYLDAADKDYKTAAINRHLVYDDTLTGLTPQLLDATGAAATATAAGSLPIVKSPITVELSNGGTAADVLSLDIYYRTS
jgi:hypothetical protein